MKPFFLMRAVACVLLIILAVASCKEHKPHFTVQGKISDADSAYLYLEERALDGTKIIDSVRLDKEGNYSFDAPAPAYPEFYALKLDNQLINLAIDSIETLTVNSSKKAFARNYSVEGSDNSSKIRTATLSQYALADTLHTAKKDFEDKKIDQSTYLSAVTKAIGSYRKVAEDIMKSDYKSMAAYYALFQRVDGMLVFDPYNKTDIRMFQTIATSWKQFRTAEPRAVQLEKLTLSVLSEIRSYEKQGQLIDSLSNKATSVTNEEYYDITLPDIKNTPVSLQSLKGKVVILDFTAYQSQYSAARNIIINSVYEKHKGKVDVYQVSFDTDDHIWRNVAINLPWICVKDPKSVQSNLIGKYNIQALPATYLLNKNGEIIKRMNPSDDLETEVKKIL